MNPVLKEVKDTFAQRFNNQPKYYYSPGRINFIGEHIDYNDGFVMPAAIDKGIYFAISENGTDTFNFYSVDFKESLSVKKDEIKKSKSWRNYVLSVINEFLILKKNIKGFDCVFAGNIANGAGMSSSAACEGGVAFAINEMNDIKFSRKELALLCQRAEHNFPGVNCGIMDQYANMFGKDNQVILLDCRSIENKYFPLDLKEYEVVLINSKVHHSLASSAYNKRREECETGLKILKNELAINSFRDIKNSDELNAVKDKMSLEVFKRCKYVIEEILRTQRAAECLQKSEIIEFGNLMYQTHEGLRDLYEVSCPELDFLVSHAQQNDAVIGSRLMGGGFGGCTINIIKSDAVKAFVESVSIAYQQKFHIDPEYYEVALVEGTHQLED